MGNYTHIRTIHRLIIIIIMHTMNECAWKFRIFDRCASSRARTLTLIQTDTFTCVLSVANDQEKTRVCVFVCLCV